jgi:hypothetical protein
MERLKVLLYEHSIDKVFLRKGEEELFTSIGGEKVIKPLSDLYNLDEDQQITSIQNRLTTVKEREEQAYTLAQEIKINGESSPIKRREKNPTVCKKYLDNIILPDTDIDDLEPPPAYLDILSPCDETPLELREIYDKNPVFEDEYSEYEYNFSDKEDEEVHEEEPLELRKEFDGEQEEKSIDEYFLDS